MNDKASAIGNIDALLDRIRLEYQSGVNMSDNTVIYRYLPLSRFLQMARKCENVLVHVSKWEDPFEGFVFKGRNYNVEHIGNKTRVERFDVIDLFKDYYGQSWTFSGLESDLRWRAYCPNGDGVRIKSTIGKLKQTLDGINRTYFKNIGYLSQGQMLAKAQSCKWSELASDEAACADFLFVKREEFALENEFRVVVEKSLVELEYENRKNGTNFGIDNGLYYCPLAKTSGGVPTLLDEILFDPRMDERLVLQIKCQLSTLSSEYNTRSGFLRQSELYKWPDFTMRM